LLVVLTGIDPVEFWVGFQLVWATGKVLRLDDRLEWEVRRLWELGLCGVCELE